MKKKFPTKTDNIQNNVSISIILPFYNDEEYLPYCLDTLSKQDFENFEIILINDGSTDGSAGICASYMVNDNRMHMLHQDHLGLGVSKTRGLTEAKGEYILFLSANDTYKTDFISTLYYKAKVSESDIVFCPYSQHQQLPIQNNFGIDGIQRDLLPISDVFNLDDCPGQILNLTDPETHNKIFRKKFLEKEKISFFHGKICEDIPFVSSAFMKANKIAYIDRPLLHKRPAININGEIKEDNWQDIVLSLQKTELLINTQEQYETIEKSFLNLALDCLFRYSNFREPIYGLFIHYLISEAIPYFHFMDHPDNYYYSQDNYKKLISIYNKNHMTKISPFLKHSLPDRKKTIPIVYTIRYESDAISCFGSIQSLKENCNPNYFYDIYIFYLNKIRLLFLEKLEDMSNASFRITPICIDSYLPVNFQQKYVDIPETYLLFIPNILYGYDKILYLSQNTIIQTDLSPIFNTAFEDNLLIGTMALGNRHHIENELKLINETYISSGVLLINLLLFSNIKKTLLELILKSNVFSKELFQDLLNIVCKNKIKTCDPKWNVQWKLLTESKKTDYPNSNNSYIINFNNISPWQKPSIEFSYIWWNYARKTPFYEGILLESLKRQKNT